LVAAVRRVRRLIPHTREVASLALVAGQDVEAAIGQAPGGSPARSPTTGSSPRRSRGPSHRKTSAQRRDGYKGHIAAEPESGLVTECAPTAANGPDGPTGVGLLAGEDPGLEVLGDTHYGSGQTRAALRAAGHLQTIKPIPLSSAGGRW
jgi:Transposase DDE domain